MKLPNLEQLKKRAKELMRAHRQGDRNATERLRAGVPKLARLSVEALQSSRLALADAQHAIAHEAGYASWPKLQRSIAIAQDARTGLLEAALSGDDESIDDSAALSAAVESSLHLACALADVDAVDRSRADVAAIAGPLKAPPLVYLCASRYRQGGKACAERRVRIARTLLERGAEPNFEYADFEHFDGKRIPLSAAAKNIGSAALLEALIAGGARRHDHSALWHTVAPGHGVDEDPLASLKTMLAQKPPGWILNFALASAVRADSFEAFELLLEAGGSPNTSGGWGGSGTLLHQAIALDSDIRMLRRLFETGDRRRTNREGRTPLAIARQLGHERAAELLEAHGETAREPEPTELALRAALTGDEVATEEFAAQRLSFARGEHQVLTWALENGRTDAVEALLRIGLDPNITADDGRTALTIALETDSARAAEALTRAGATLGSFDDDKVATDSAQLFEDAAQAVVDGDLATLTRFLDEHADLVRWRSPRGHRATLLHYIGANGLETQRQKTPANAVAVCELLLERGAEPDSLCATYGGGPAQTTLALLASSGWPAEAGLQRELVLALCRAGALPDGIDDDGVPLATAIGFGCRDAVAGLVEAGARIDNVLFAAAVGRTDLIEPEVHEGEVRPESARCRVDWFWASDDPQKTASRALGLAASFGQRQVVDLLLARGVDPCHAAQNGETPLHSACYQGHVDVVKQLLAAGADPQLRDSNYQSTCFGWALEGKRFEVIDLLRAHTLPCLTDAVDCGLVAEARQHLERDPSEVDAPAGRGGLLLWSAQQGRREMVELLLEFGADRTVKREGKTPLEWAAAGGHDEIVRMLTDDEE